MAKRLRQSHSESSHIGSHLAASGLRTQGWLRLRRSVTSTSTHFRSAHLCEQVSMLMRTSHATEKHILSDDHMGHGQEGFRSAASSSFSKAEAVAQGTNNPLKMSCADQDSRGSRNAPDDGCTEGYSQRPKPRATSLNPPPQSDPMPERAS